MADSIAAAFAAAREQGRAALMPYMMGGFPDRDSSLEIARAYAENGADLIELGIPFSDPLADGPVIHEAAVKALEAGTRLEDVLAICAEVSGRVPVVLMVQVCGEVVHVGSPSCRRGDRCGRSAIVRLRPVTALS